MFSGLELSAEYGKTIEIFEKFIIYHSKQGFFVSDTITRKIVSVGAKR